MAKYEFIDSQTTEPGAPPIERMCRWLSVSRSGFYHWRSRPVSATAARRAVLTERIRHYFTASDETYGYRRIHADLAAEGTECSAELVRQIMRQEGLVPCQPRPFRITTIADAEAAAAIPDLVERDFTAEAPGTKFVGDITYIHTWQGFVYLATVIDCYSKKVVGWAIEDHMRAELVETALANAAQSTVIAPRGDLAFGPRCPVHLGLVPGPGGLAGDAGLDGPDRGVLGQRRGGELLLGVEE